MGNKFFEMGRSAAKSGKIKAENPYLSPGGRVPLRHSQYEHDEWLKGFESVSTKSFQNAPGKKAAEYKGYSIQDYGNNNFVIWTDNGNGFSSMNASSIQEAKSKIDANPHPKFQPGSRQSEMNNSSRVQNAMLALIHFHSNADKLRFKKRMGGFHKGDGLFQEGEAYLQVEVGSKLYEYAGKAAEVYKISNSRSFQNGRIKAEQYINSKLEEAGVKIETPTGKFITE